VQIHLALIRKQPITKLSMHIVSEISKLIGLLYPNSFPSTVSHLWTDNNNGKSTATFTSLSLPQFNSVIVFVDDSFKRFNIRQDFPQLIVPSGNQAGPIAFDSNYDYAFEM
jgi:hypothetical protein